MRYAGRKLTNIGIFELQNGVTFDLEALQGRSKVRLKAETSYFFIIEISELLGTMLRSYNGKKSFVGFHKNEFLPFRIM